jgi:hypothetical protein
VLRDAGLASVTCLGSAECCVGAASRVSGAVGGVLRAGVDCVCAREQLLGAAPLGLGRGLIANGGWGIEVGLLVVEQRLMFAARALCVVEHVL